MQGGSSGIGYGLKYQVVHDLLHARSFVNLRAFLMVENLLFSGQMYIGC